MRLREIERYNNQGINKHSNRVYLDDNGNLYHLDRTLDGCPPFFSASGPYKPEFRGLLPRLSIDGKDYWGDGLSWNKAEAILAKTLGAEIVHKTPKHDEVLNKLFEFAVKRGDGYRQWFYPNLPHDYAINKEVFILIDNGIIQGKSVLEIAESIYKLHG